MSGRWINRWIAAAAGLILAGFLASAQDGTYNGYTPYSVYGIGELHTSGSAYNSSMGGIGIANRTRRYVNYMNPASITARDSLSFMADYSMSAKTSIYTQGDRHSAKNLFNINDFVISFPIYRSSAMMIGITPLSNTGYDFTYIETDQNLIGRTGTQAYSASGNGSIYQFFTGGAVTFWKRLSLGAEYILNFGNIDKNVDLTFSNTTFRSIESGYTLQLRGSTAKFGVQYEQPIGARQSLVVGATYRLKSSIKGYSTDFAYANMSSLVDTLRHREINLSEGNKIRFGDELGFGISYRSAEKWSAEIDYVRSDWRNSGFENVNGFSNVSAYTFTSGVAQSLRAGFEITPNRSDIRYRWKRCTYRAGAYYEQSYYRLDGKSIDSFGITLGATIPVFQGYNGVTVGLDFGKKGTVANNGIRDNYIGLNIGFNIFDIWFVKQRYD